MVSLIGQIFAFLATFTLFGIGTWTSIIGGSKQMRTNSPSEGILLIVVGASIVALSGLIASIIVRLLGS